MGHGYMYYPTVSKRPSANERAMDAFVLLRDAMEDALQNDPTRKVQTPGWGSVSAPAEEVVLDQCSGRGDESMADLLRILGAITRCESLEHFESVKRRAALWISVQAAKYATYHRDDMVEGDEQ